MKKRTCIAFSVIFLAALFTSGSAAGQVRGRELYDLMGREQLTVSEGVSSVTWLPDGKGYRTAETDSVTGYTAFFTVDPESGKRSALFDRETVSGIISAYNEITGHESEGLPFERFTFFDGGNFIHFGEGVFQYVYDRRSSEMWRFRSPDPAHQPGSDDLMRRMATSQLRRGSFSPDYRKFAYIKGYDIYVSDMAGNETRVTFGGSEEVMNGRPDWVYPEELLQRDAYWWSPDGRKIAYLQYDERPVYRYPIIHELTSEARLERERYPTAGQENPVVRLFVVDTSSGKTTVIETRSSGDVYIFGVRWRNDGSELLFYRMNRRQDYLQVKAADPETGSVRTILTEQSDTFITADVNGLIQLGDGERFLWISERTGWRHIFLYDFDGREIARLTDGELVVGSVLLVDEHSGYVYFTAHINEGLEQHFFRVTLDGSHFTRLTTEAGYHHVSINPTGMYYTDTYSSLTTPPVTNLHRSDGKLIRNLGRTNTEKLDALQLETPELITFTAADGTTDLHGLVFRPAGFDPAGSYPLLLSVYGGPGVPGVHNTFASDNRLQRLAQGGFIVAQLDNRGILNRGKNFESATYLKLGQVDLADQTAGVTYLTGMPYVDATRVGVFGWSYGGYMTCLALLKEPGVFHVGVAGAPVTDYRNYDTIYTERYMRTPQENPDGYDAGSALRYADNLRGRLYLVHGTTDNNVHPANTIQLIHALVEAGKSFDLMLYPEQRHGIDAVSRDHFNRLLFDYFVEHLHPDDR